MNGKALLTVLFGAALVLWLLGGDDSRPSAKPVSPAPSVPDTQPSPCPGPCPPKPKPKPGPKGPWGEEAGAPVGAQVGGVVAPDGATQIDVDLPEALHRKNVTSKGQGCCVFTSIHHAALWQNVPALQEFPKWLQEKGLEGGGYSGNVRERITAICKERGYPEPSYIQVDGKDMTVLQKACATGRFPAVTYSKSPTGRYNGGRIAHMVSMPGCTEQWVAILDNNYIGAGNYEWMTHKEYLDVCNLGGNYWAVILLNPGPPPPPRNK
ncbi:MAG: hypothetical protein K2R98_08450 [Gemmataceae bacterium]|nr:hypothetical protein [Gemmataceae bacterium]